MANILIMDDEASIRNIIYIMLKPLGFPIFTAEDGRQAIEIARKESPAVAILDIRVPDMDGLEVLAELKKLNPDIKCIMLSGFADGESAEAAMKLGAYHYCSKPFRIDDLMNTVNKALKSLNLTAPATKQGKNNILRACVTAVFRALGFGKKVVKQVKY
jgi:DNA-binding NtrC family response regulator